MTTPKRISGGKEMERCCFDKKDGCHALVCYANTRCKSRDKSGNPMYVPLEKIKNTERTLPMTAETKKMLAEFLAEFIKQKGG